MEKIETVETGFFVFDPVSGCAISENNRYVEKNPNWWHRYPSEQAAKAARTMCKNCWTKEVEYFKKWPDSDVYKQAAEHLKISETLEIRPYKITTTFEF